MGLPPFRDVYNVKQVELMLILAGRSPLVALFYALRDRSDAHCFDKYGAQRELTHLLIISPSAKVIYRQFSAEKVWMIYLTYKNNWNNCFGLPLMQVWEPRPRIKHFRLSFASLLGNVQKIIFGR